MTLEKAPARDSSDRNVHFCVGRTERNLPLPWCGIRWCQEDAKTRPRPRYLGKEVERQMAPGFLMCQRAPGTWGQSEQPETALRLASGTG